MGPQPTDSIHTSPFSIYVILKKEQVQNKQTNEGYDFKVVATTVQLGTSFVRVSCLTRSLDISIQVWAPCIHTLFMNKNLTFESLSPPTTCPTSYCRKACKLSLPLGFFSPGGTSRRCHTYFPVMSTPQRLKFSSLAKHKPLLLSFLHLNLRGTSAPPLHIQDVSGHLYLVHRQQFLFT